MNAASGVMMLICLLLGILVLFGILVAVGARDPSPWFAAAFIIAALSDPDKETPDE